MVEFASNRPRSGDFPPLSIAREAAERFAALVPEALRPDSAARKAGLRAAIPLAGDAGAMTARRLQYLSRTASQERAKAAVKDADVARPQTSQSDTLATIGNERIIGDSDLVDINYLELAIAVGRAIARIRIGNAAGTGSLVGPRILLTNHHVIHSVDEARQALAQFDYQDNASGELLPVHGYALDPDLLFFTDPKLDCTFVGVAQTSQQGRSIEEYPWLRLIAQLGKADRGDPVNIIQHPRGGLKQIALRNNQVIDIPQASKSFLYYTTDTEPGSSGSPCFNDQWEIIALHHSGVPRMENGKILKHDGQPFVEGRDDPALIQWIANEGARTSAVVEALKAAPLQGASAELRDRMLDSSSPNPVELARRAPGAGSGQAAPATSLGQGAVSITVPLTITLSLGTPSGVAVSTPPAPPPVSKPPAPPESLEAVVIDPDWSNRQGYDPDFLGVSVPLPKLSEAQQKLAVVVPPDYRARDDRFAFPYHHYSLVMHRKRRFAWFTAAMIDGARMKDLVRKDNWYYDPRIDPPDAQQKIQCGKELYAAADTDFGHITRFKDLSWGDSRKEAQAAVNDSFHFSNCCLQLHGFNTGKDRWQGLELFLLENKARKEQRQLAVMTGPVFRATDPLYQNEKMDYAVRIPLNFWKLCALVRDDGTLSVTAFMLDQEDVAGLPDMLEKFDAGPAQITVAQLEKKTGLSFGNLKKHDPLAAGADPGTLESAELKTIPLQRYEDIVV